MERPENPPAFPHESYDADADMDTVKTGMSLRDWFAGQALAGTMAYSGNGYGDQQLTARQIASVCFDIADAMLAKREGGSDA